MRTTARWYIKFLQWKTQYLTHRQFILLLCGLVGVATGFAALAMRSLTHFIEEVLVGNIIRYINYGFYVIFPAVGFLLVYWVKKYIIRKEVSHGIPSILYAVAKQKGIMKRFQAYGSILTAPITIGFGGSVGLEGPMVVTGAGISSQVARLFHINQSDRMLLLACACAAALAAIFKVPLAGILFAIEVFGLDLTLSSLLPLFVASLSGVLTSYIFFGNAALLPIYVGDSFLMHNIPFYLLLGVVGGFMSAYFTFVYEGVNRFFSKFSSAYLRIVIGGAILGLLVFVMPPLYGEGHEVINHLKAGHPELSISSNIFGWNLENPWVVILLLGGLVLFKVVATSVTFGAGGVGGIFSPMLFMGGVMGNCFARIINQIDILPYKLPLANFTLIGMTALMTGVLHAPLTAIFLIAEVTGGYSLFVPAMVTAVVSFSIAKYFNKYSIYTMELGRKGELVNQDKDQAILTLMDMESVIETNFVPVYTDMTLKGVVYEAVRESSRNIFPVLDREKGSLEGVILLDDIRHLIFEKELYDKVSVLEMMQPPPALIQMGQDTMNQVMDKFQNTAAWNLPVVKNGKYIGFISKSKLLTVYRRKLIYFSNNK
ncbi:chloride channel protein [Capnocytophaga gingivalis]|jgi:putative chloride channel|uniref:Chloride channel protein n=2 Tax=Capnocytophaga gingivalis TaxID=1017 RepID=A0A250FPP9_9FLAO|nr:chloride channel protein [Capnocytophaga gingivalis]ATA87054.1 chloride channel protein [Capnocytophaga gingivalis]EEK15214.1 chloride transporter, ClC family [Capnocytophaga gingivalis ATCC 33624]MEB3014485.1 chloride channel protein [Capnocytophaga gingivalis]RKW11508.1 MAG: chloride channel protein [Capnocytophaga sp.]